MDRDIQYESKKRILQKEFMSFWNYIFLWPLRLSGWSRIEVQNDRIISKTKSSVFFNLAVIFSIDISFAYIMYVEVYRDNYLWSSEIIVLCWFTFYHHVILLNNVLFNRHGAARVLNYFMEIDILLGVRQTKFIRKVAVRSYAVFCVYCAIAEILVIIAVIHTYKVDNSLFPFGLYYFYEVYYAYYDLVCLFASFTSLTMRLRYLNVAVLKIANVNPQRLPSQFPFNTFFWVSKFDDLVDFHKKHGTGEFIKAYIMIFKQLRNFERCYRFSISLHVIGMILASFVSVQSFITFYKSDTFVATDRLFAITGWALIAWFIVLLIAEQTDMFVRQIYQAHLICHYIQLKPNYPAEIYKLTKKVLGTLENHDPRVNIYNIYNLNKGMVLRVASSIFIYITMQLQIAFPKSIESAIKDNATIVFNVTK